MQRLVRVALASVVAIASIGIATTSLSFFVSRPEAENSIAQTQVARGESALPVSLPTQAIITLVDGAGQRSGRIIEMNDETIILHTGKAQPETIARQDIAFIEFQKGSIVHLRNGPMMYRGSKPDDKIKILDRVPPRAFQVTDARKGQLQIDLTLTSLNADQISGYISNSKSFSYVVNRIECDRHSNQMTVTLTRH
ncbi:hypothetical protein [Roseofilum casamattae]|uniref:FecR protein domain-containing protein n=1 Tax=Roseofilum casamattae BLCC-M143 TaxID=3022442 RepID=A0ABT7C122_9CYAN|nr:hypothetical protein [Roseofilum casamattae]MDJ1185141.1 hypothetical protein [Roseofilum casamattae BLCC-M143]